MRTRTWKWYLACVGLGLGAASAGCGSSDGPSISLNRPAGEGDVDPLPETPPGEAPVPPNPPADPGEPAPPLPPPTTPAVAVAKPTYPNCPTAVATAQPAGAEVPPPTSGWTFVGGRLSSADGLGTGSEAPAVVLDTAGRPVVAWLETTLTGATLFVRRWNGTAYENLGPGLRAFGEVFGTRAGAPSLTLDGTGLPVVAWSEDISGGSVRIAACAWDGTVWKALGSAVSFYPSPTPTRAESAAIRTLRDGTAIIAWSEKGASQPSFDLFVARWTGVEWQYLGTPLSAVPAPAGMVGSDARRPALAVDRSGMPTIAWEEDTPGTAGTATYAARWNGSTWVGLGTLGAGGVPAIALDNRENPVVARVQGVVSVSQWNGSAWEAVDKPTTGPESSPALASDGRGGLTLAFLSGGSVTVLQRERRGAWRSSGSGINAVPGNTQVLSVNVAVNEAGRGAVAFSEQSAEPGLFGTPTDVFTAVSP